MKISELIKELQEVQAEHGDVECFSHGIDGGAYGVSEISVTHEVGVGSWSVGTKGKTRTYIDQFSNGDQTVVTI